MPQLQRRLWNLLRTPLLFYFLGYLPYRLFLSLSLGDDHISGFRRERVWLIFTRPVKNSIPLLYLLPIMGPFSALALARRHDDHLFALFPLL